MHQTLRYITYIFLCIILLSTQHVSASIFEQIRAQNQAFYKLHPQKICVNPQEVAIRILMYHYVRPQHRDPAGSFISGNSVTPETFQQHMKYLKDLDNKGSVQVATMTDIYNWHQENCFPHTHIIVPTADDGRRDNYHYLFKITGMYELPFTLGIIYDKIGFGENRIDPFMTYEEIKEMIASGRIDIQSHSMTHTNLKYAGYMTQLYELCESKAGLETLFDIEIQTFIYPIGGYNSSAIQLAQQCGYTYATTTQYGTVNIQELTNSPYTLQRIRVSERSDMYSLFGQ